MLSEESFFKICVLSQYIVYWIRFQNIHTFTYQKTLLHTLLLIIFKIVESLQCILNLTCVLIYLLTKYVLEDDFENFVKVAVIYPWRSLLLRKLQYFESLLFERSTSTNIILRNLKNIIFSITKSTNLD